MSVDSTPTRIRGAAIELFAAKGFAGTGIRELADQVGISTASLYHHISTKDDLLDLIVDTSMNALNRIGGHWANHQAGVDVRLAGLIASHVVVHALAPDEATVVDRQLSAMRPGSRRRAVGARDAYERSWRELISEGTVMGTMTPDDPDLATRALLGATSAVADWYRPDGPVEKLKLGDAYVALGFRMLGARAVPPTPDLGPALALFTNRWENQ